MIAHFCQLLIYVLHVSFNLLLFFSLLSQANIHSLHPSAPPRTNRVPEARCVCVCVCVRARVRAMRDRREEGRECMCAVSWMCQRERERAGTERHRGQFSLAVFHSHIRYYASCFEGGLALEQKVRRISFTPVLCLCGLCVFVARTCPRGCTAPCGHHCCWFSPCTTMWSCRVVPKTRLLTECLPGSAVGALKPVNYYIMWLFTA